MSGVGNGRPQRRPRIAVFDYGAGNLHSLVKAISTPARSISIETDLRAALDADLLVLPGVGAFGTAAGAIARDRASVATALRDGFPCVGVCLGMQLLFESSEEGAGEGFGFIPGRVTRLRAPKVPHMGWNQIEWRNEPADGIPGLPIAYFANTYACEPDDDSTIAAWTTHQGVRFASVVRASNTVGVQFHPEKSSLAGCSFINAVIGDLLERRAAVAGAQVQAAECR